MPYGTRKTDGQLVNVTTSGPHRGRVHGTFPRTHAGYARAAGQVAIMQRATRGEGRTRRRRRRVWGRRKLRRGPHG